MRQKKLIIFDLDGTLAPSKSPMDGDMSELLARLLRTKMVAVISGGSLAQFQKQFLGSLSVAPDLLKNLYLFPTCGAAFYRYDEVRTHLASTPLSRCEECVRDARRAEEAVATALQQRQATRQLARTPATRRDTADCPHRGVAPPRSIASDTPSEVAPCAAGQSASIATEGTCEMGSAAWQCVYTETLSPDEKMRAGLAFTQTFRDLSYKHPAELFGDVLEDRGTQITFSALGQRAPLPLKAAWDPDSQKRLKIAEALKKYLPDLEVRVGGTTSIDVTRPGVDKAYGIKKMEEYLGVTKAEMLFVGDKVFPGGNDYPAKEAGVECVPVENPDDTKGLIRALLVA